MNIMIIILYKSLNNLCIYIILKVQETGRYATWFANKAYGLNRIDPVLPNLDSTFSMLPPAPITD